MSRKKGLRVGGIRRQAPLILALFISAGAGVAFPFMHGIFSVRLIFWSAFLACFLTLFVALFETHVYARRMSKMSIKRAIAIKSVAYATVISTSYLTLATLIKSEGELVARVLTFETVFTFSLAASVIVSAFVTISRILGQHELVRLVVGRYHKPREEHRAVMFVDMVSSTQIAERLGSVAFMSLLNDFFLDLTVPILDFGGEIYKYVGDEVIVTWKVKKGFHPAACLDCYFEMREQVSDRASAYQKKYSMVPDFRAGIHCGKVVIGEMGDFKKEIAILGDTLNTTARITEAAAEKKRPILVSEDFNRLLTEADLHEKNPEDRAKDRFAFENLGTIPLKGKEHPLQLFAVNQVTAPSVIDNVRSLFGKVTKALSRYKKAA